MYVVFADDSRQKHPSRPGMGPLIGVGGIGVHGDVLGLIERDIDELCDETGFPPNEEFKWSPHKDMWMYSNLVTEERFEFFVRLLEIQAAHGAFTVGVIEDEKCKTADQRFDHETDTTMLFIERVHNHLANLDTTGIIITDRPRGGIKIRREDEFLERCLRIIKKGTDYVLPDRIAISPVSTSSCLIRMLQTADLAISCTMSRIAGEQEYSPPVFDKLLSLFARAEGRIGGIGLKLHPDFKYENLYHWLTHDKIHMDNHLPNNERPYAQSGDRYRSE